MMHMTRFLIEEIKEFPLKIMILEKWARTSYFGLNQVEEKLSRGWVGTWIEYDNDGLCYCDIGTGSLTWDSYALIQQLEKEKGKIVVCVDANNLVQHAWTGWTELLLEKFFPRKDWTKKKSYFILKLKLIWKLLPKIIYGSILSSKLQGQRLKNLSCPNLKSSPNPLRKMVNFSVIQQEIELNLKIRSLFESDFCNKGGHPLLKGSDVDRCFDLYLFPLPDFPEDSQDPYDYDSDISWTEEEWHNIQNRWKDNASPKLFVHILLIFSIDSFRG
jgi:hypothetical protein